jgi:CBS domain-containing protein
MSVTCPICGEGTETISIFESGIRKPLHVCNRCIIAWEEKENGLGIHLLQTYAMAKDLDDDAYYELLKRISDYESRGVPKLCDIMSRDVVTISRDKSAHEAAKLMADRRISCLIVVDRDGKPEGIITSGDLVEKVSVPKRDPDKVKVEEIMSSPVITAEDYTNIIKASKIMREKRIKKLPVTEKGRLVGIVTVTDFAKASPEYLEKIASNLAELSDTFRFFIKKEREENSGRR